MENNKNYIRVERHKWPDEIEAEKRRTRKRFGIVLLCLVCFGGGFMASIFSGVSSSASGTTPSLSDSSKFNEIYEIMRDEWFYGKDIENLEEYLLTNAIMGLTRNEYDIHSNYLNEKSASSFMQKLEGSIIGIGVEYTTIDDLIFITKVYANSPAQKAGIKEGDFIVKVNGISMKDKTSEEAKELITGEEGTSVSISILRDQKEITKDLIRSNVSVSAYGYVKDTIGILELSSFSETSAKESEMYLKQFKNKGLDHLIIDVRGNTGGYVDSAIKIASFFMEEDKVVLREEERNGKTKEYVTKKSDQYEFANIVVLVDEDTASASEALAACLNEQIGAKLVGVKTYGKGSVQVQKVFSDGSYFKYTTAQWTTPNGNIVNKKGIEPDVEVKLDEALTYTVPNDDKQYKVDSVGDNIKSAQIYLRFLGYDVDRVDGYYSTATFNALKQFQTKQNLKVDGIISKDVVLSLMSKVNAERIIQKDKYDVQLNKAIEVVNGK